MSVIIDKKWSDFPCKEFQGLKDSHGYGRVLLGNRQEKKAHRVAWEREFYPIPKGMQVCHHCDNPPCIEREHLFLGTHQDNIDDKVSKGRQARGMQTGPKSNLTEEHIRQIRRMLETGFMQKDIAECYGVAPSIISKIKYRKIWGWVE